MAEAARSELGQQLAGCEIALGQERDGGGARRPRIGAPF
jgi:hypothetical protein